MSEEIRKSVERMKAVLEAMPPEAAEAVAKDAAKQAEIIANYLESIGQPA